MTNLLLNNFIYRREAKLSSDELLTMFDECDSDKSGSLSWSEFRMALSRKGFGLEFIEVLV